MYFITLTYEGTETGENCFSICDSKFPIRGRFPAKNDFNFFEKSKFKIVNSTQSVAGIYSGPGLGCSK